MDEPSPKIERNNTIRLSSLPCQLRESARALVDELDADGDGYIDSGELTAAINALATSRKKNRRLGRTIAGMTLAILLLIGAVFGSSIAAARLSKDINTDEETGIMYVKGTGDVAKTGMALHAYDRSVANLTDLELLNLYKVIEGEYKTQFHVKGHARTVDNEVIVLVEGGTLTYDVDNGLKNATGDALFILQSAGFGTKDNSNRKLPSWAGCDCFTNPFAGCLACNIGKP